MSIRRLSILFAVLDVSYLLTYCHRIPNLLANVWNGHVLNGTMLLMYLALVFSAYGFLCQRPWTYWLSYLLFPFRIGLAVLSFSWLAELVLTLSPPNPRLHDVVWLSAVALAGVRLGLTVMLHHMHTPFKVAPSESASSKPA